MPQADIYTPMGMLEVVQGCAALIYQDTQSGKMSCPDFW